MKHAFIDLTDPTVFQSFGGETYWERVDVPKDTMILQEGEASQDFYYIFSGSVAVTKALNAAGEKKHLANLVGGDFFGEGALLSDKMRSANVHATENTVLLRLSRAKFEALIQADPNAATGIVLGIVKVLNSRLQGMDERFIVLSNVVRFNRAFQGDAQRVIPAIFQELLRVMPEARFVLFNTEGLPQFMSEGWSQDQVNTLQMSIPDVAHTLQQKDYPDSLLKQEHYYCALNGLQGAWKGVLAVPLPKHYQDQDLRLLSTVAEQIASLL